LKTSGSPEACSKRFRFDPREKSPRPGESLRIQFINITSACSLACCSSHDRGLTWSFMLSLSILSFYSPISMLLTLARGGSKIGSRSGGGSESGSGGGNGKIHGDPICQRRCVGSHPIRPIANRTGWLILKNVSNLLDGVIREKQVLQCSPESGIWMLPHPLWGPGLRAIPRLCGMVGRRRT